MEQCTTSVIKATAAVFLAAVGLFGAACRDNSEESVFDPIVGLWSTDSLLKGSLWVGYTPDGQVVYILDPTKAPGTIANLETIIAVYESTGRWSRKGSVYKVVMSRGGKEMGTKFYKPDGVLLVECGQDGVSKAGGEQWSQKMPADKALEFIAAYMKAKKDANAGK